MYRGKIRKLLVVHTAESNQYRVFCESELLGLMRAEEGEGLLIWKTDYNMLKPIVSKIGAYIEACEQYQ